MNVSDLIFWEKFQCFYDYKRSNDTLFHSSICKVAEKWELAEQEIFIKLYSGLILCWSRL